MSSTFDLYRSNGKFYFALFKCEIFTIFLPADDLIANVEHYLKPSRLNRVQQFLQSHKR